MTRKTDRIAANGRAGYGVARSEARKTRRFRSAVRSRIQGCPLGPATSLPKMPRSGRFSIVAWAARGGPGRPGMAVATPFSCRTLRVKKSLPDRAGCSMINNLPKLMGESAARGRFQDENLKLLSVAHGDMECRNIVPLGRITAVIHSRDGGRSQVFTCRLRKSAIPVNCWSLRTNSSIKKQS